MAGRQLCERWITFSTPWNLCAADAYRLATDRCGLESTRYGQQGFVLVENAAKLPLGVFYSAIQNSIRWQEPCGLEFTFEDDRGLFRVEIIGGSAPDATELMKWLQMQSS